ncbi:ORP3B [Scenedesmus sp. PABB004]|nr:ORP3B [Scenedesmus sp. PABB004]
MEWLSNVGNLVLGTGGDAETKPEPGGVAIVANAASSDGGADAAAQAALAEEELAALGLGDSRDGYLAEVGKVLLQPSKIGKYIGMDMTSIASVPLFINEPFSMLQKMAEIMEYTALLDAANAAEDPFERLALVAAFLVSPFGAAERTWRPFTPLLGETFELEALGSGVRFLAEQVSQQPPVSVAHAESGAFTYDIVSAPATKFQGNSLEVYPKGRTRITLRRTGELFSHVPPQAKVHNLVLGRTWIDSFGTFLVTNNATGDKVQLDFKPCGWFGAGQYEFDGHVLDAAGNARSVLSGKWNSHVDLTPCGADGAPAEGAEPRRLWTCAAKPEDDPYGCTHFAWDLNSCKFLSKPPLASDSRRRGDRHALEKRELSAAGAEKAALEERERGAKKAQEERGQEWQARWFEPAPDMQVLPGEEPADVVPLWRWNGRYTQTRDGMPAGEGSWQDEVCGKGFNFPDEEL